MVEVQRSRVHNHNVWYSDYEKGDLPKCFHDTNSENAGG